MTFRNLAVPGYLVGATVFFVPVFDALMTVAPPHLHDARWRFGAFGLLSNAAMLPAIGVFIAYGVATACEHWRFLRVMGWLSFLLVATEAVMLVIFLLDATQTHSTVRPQMYLSFEVATYTAVAKILIGMATFIAFGLAGVRTPRKRVASSPLPMAGLRGIPVPANTLTKAGG